MITISGKSVFGGVSIGKLVFYKRNDKVIKRIHVDDVDAEWKRFQDAKDTAVSLYADHRGGHGHDPGGSFLSSALFRF